METKTLTLDKNDPKVIDDAVRMSKSDFTAVYEALGYNKTLVGVAWHTIKTSPAGRAKIDEYKQNGLPSIETQPATFIGNVAEEVQERKESEGKKTKVKKEKVVKEKVAKVKKEKAPKTAKPVKEKKEKSGKKGDKSQAIKDLIAAGETDWKVLVEKTGASVVYTKRVLAANKKA